MEVLSRMLSRAVEGGLIEGFGIGRDGDDHAQVTISHLLYADDTLIFCGAKKDKVGYLRCVLLGFEAVSGLRINLAKSEITPIGPVP